MPPGAPLGVRANPQAGHSVGAERPTNLKRLPPASGGPPEQAVSRNPQPSSSWDGSTWCSLSKRPERSDT